MLNFTINRVSVLASLNRISVSDTSFEFHFGLTHFEPSDFWPRSLKLYHQTLLIVSTWQLFEHHHQLFELQYWPHSFKLQSLSPSFELRYLPKSLSFTLEPQYLPQSFWASVFTTVIWASAPALIIRASVFSSFIRDSVIQNPVLQLSVRLHSWPYSFDLQFGLAHSSFSFGLSNLSISIGSLFEHQRQPQSESASYSWASILALPTCVSKTASAYFESMEHCPSKLFVANHIQSIYSSIVFSLSQSSSAYAYHFGRPVELVTPLISCWAEYISDWPLIWSVIYLLSREYFWSPFNCGHFQQPFCCPAFWDNPFAEHSYRLI